MATAISYSNLAITSAVLGCCIVQLACLLWFHRRRSHEPIKTRFWWQSEVIGVFCLAYTLLRGLGLDIVGFPCPLQLLGLSVVFQLPVFLTIRVAHVISIFEKAKADALSNAEQQKVVSFHFTLNRKDGSVKTWTRTHSTAIQNTKLQVLVCLVACGITAGVCYLFTPAYLLQCRVVDISSLFVLPVILLGLLYGVPLLLVLFKTKTHADDLSLMLELKLAMLSCIPLAAYYVFKYNEGITSYEADLISIFLALPLFIVVVLIPIAWTYIWEKRRRLFHHHTQDGTDEEDDDDLEDLTRREFDMDPLVMEGGQPVFVKMLSSRMLTSFTSLTSITGSHASKKTKPVVLVSFRSIMRDPDGRRALKQYSILRLAHESMLFYEACMYFLREFADVEKASKSTSQMRENAFEIYELFLKPGSKCQVNVSSAVAEGFLESGVLSRHDFDKDKAYNAVKQARHEIFRLMKDELYYGFTRHEIYAKYISEKDQISSMVESFF